MKDRDLDAFLWKIQRGQLGTVCIFHDWLRENGHRYPKELELFEKALAKWQSGVCCDLFRVDWTAQRYWTKETSVGAWHGWFRDRVARAFGRKWKLLPNRKDRHLPAYKQHQYRLYELNPPEHLWFVEDLLKERAKEEEE